MGRFSCLSCRNKTCLMTEKPCAKVEAMLPSMRSGEHDRLNYVGSNLEIHTRENIRLRNIAEIRKRIDRAFLTPRERVVAELALWQGQETKELALALNISARQARRLVNQTRKRLGVSVLP